MYVAILFIKITPGCDNQFYFDFTAVYPTKICFAIDLFKLTSLHNHDNGVKLMIFSRILMYKDNSCAERCIEVSTIRSTLMRNSCVVLKIKKK